MDSIASRATRRVGAVCHTSGHRWCMPHHCPALVSIIERDYAGGVLRSVVWCSLRGGEQHCAESCLLDFSPPAVAPIGDAPPRP